MELDNLFHKIPIGIGTINNRIILSVNNYICEKLGYSREELVGADTSILYYNQDEYTKTGETLYSTLHKNGSCDIELKLKHNNGTAIYTWARVIWQDSLDPGKGILLVAQNFTDMSMTRRAMQDNENRFLQAGSFANFGVWEINLDSGWMTADETYRKLMGYSVSDKFETPDDWLQCIASEKDRQAGKIYLRQFINNQITCINLEHKARKKDGTVIQAELTAEVSIKEGQKHLLGFSRDITEYHEMREALKKQREEYRFIIDSTSAILFSADPVTLHFDFISSEAESLLGYPVDRFTQEVGFFINHIHPDDKQRVFDCCTSMSKKGLAHNMNYRFIKADGSIVWLHDRVNVITDINNEKRLAGALFDITSQKEAEAQVRTLSNVVEQSPDAIVLTDEEFKIVYINQAFTQMLGFNEEEIIGQPPGLLCVHDDKDDYISQLAEKLRLGENIFDVTKLQRKDQSSFVGQFWISVLRDDQKKIIGHVGALRDITSHVQQEHAIKEAEARYRMLYESIPQGVVLLQADGSIITANPAAERIMGFTTNHMNNLLTLDLTHPVIREDGSTIKPHTHPAMVALRTETPVKNQVIGFYNPEKHAYIWINVDAVPLQNKTDELYDRVFISFSDISESRQLQQALIKRQRMEAVGQLTGGIAHDFNNILGSILGFTELARLNFGQTSEKLDNYLTQIETAGGRARDLIKELMIFSRGESTREATPQSLVPQIEKSIKLLRPLLGSNILLDTHFEEPGPSIEIDPLHLQQLLMNLCLNARDAMGGTGKLAISVENLITDGQSCDLCNSKVCGEWAQISVSDSGDGIPKHIINDIYQPFVSSKDVGEGSGMGLAVVKGIVETYKGHVLTNTSSEGTTFRILLPLSATD